MTFSCFIYYRFRFIVPIPTYEYRYPHLSWKTALQDHILNLHKVNSVFSNFLFDCKLFGNKVTNNGMLDIGTGRTSRANSKL